MCVPLISLPTPISIQSQSSINMYRKIPKYKIVNNSQFFINPNTIYDPCDI